MAASPEEAKTAGAQASRGGNPWLQLVMATIGFAINFWAWALISPLGPLFSPDKKDLGAAKYSDALQWLPFSDHMPLTSSQASLMVAVPVIVGSIGRIPVGALTDKFGGRLMFPVVSVITIIPVLVIGFWAQNTFAGLLIGGVFLGIGGTTFAIGVPFVNSWFPPEKRGMAVGIFGAGMGGTAISALTTVQIYKNHGQSAPFTVVAIALAIFAVVAWFVMRDVPNRVIPTVPMMQRLKTVARLPISWQASILYAVTFGGYVAFTVFLPLYLKNAYGLSASDASARMAGFVVVAVICRPLGGTLSDRIGALRVLVVCLVLTVIGAAIATGNPPLHGYGTADFLVLAAALGAGSGATFALISHATDPAKVGGVTGLVGAAGGLGGFVPPLVMSWIYTQTGEYRIGMWLLAITAALTMALTLTVIRKTTLAAATSKES